MEEDTDKKLISLFTKKYPMAAALHLAALIICLRSVPFSIIPTVLLYLHFALPRLNEKKVKQENNLIKKSPA